MVEAEQRLEADRQSRPRAHVPHGQQHAGHEGAAVHRVVPDRQRLAVGAEHDLLVRDQPRQPHGVHPDPVDVRAARAGQLLGGGVRRRTESGVPARLREQGRGADRGAGRGVDLPGVVQLDHLDRLEEPRGLAGELHGEHGADAEVGGDEHVPGALGEPAADRVEPGGVEPAGADDGGDAVVEREAHVVQERRRDG